MAAFFKTAAPPGRDPARVELRPVLTIVWRLDDAGRLTRRWQAAAG